MTSNQTIVITKEVVSSGSGLLLWVPQTIVRNLKLNEKNFININLKKFNVDKSAKFLKKFKKVGKRLFIWIPLDVVEYLNLKAKDMVQAELEIL